MLNNGLDFILNSLGSVEAEDEDIKYAVLHLHAGVLLLLKERLASTEWELLFQDIKKADINLLRTGDFQSVNYKSLMERLEKKCDVNIEDNLKNKLNWLKNERNKMEHYEVKIEVEAFRARIVELFVYFIPFVQKELIEKKVLDEHEYRWRKIRDYLHDMGQYIEFKIKHIIPKIEESEYIFDCPRCNQYAVELTNKGRFFCNFCDVEFKDFAEEYKAEFIDWNGISKDGDQNPLYSCPECENEDLIVLDNGYVCLSCGISPSEDEITLCLYCEKAYAYVGECDSVEFCNSCLEYIDEQ
ncbi:hypothetical protein CN929_06180 [Bacillus thuringiensis]|nr:hypothetical protein CN929_06180 [Bacillus thuringiensis]